MTGVVVALVAAVFQIARVIDGDTVTLTNGQHVRLVQIDTPEVYGHPECFGKKASARTKQLLPPGTKVRLLPDPASPNTDRYGRLLRYVIKADSSVNINIKLVTEGVAAPYFYRHQQGRYAARLARLAQRARTLKLGLWGACPNTRYDPFRNVNTGPAA